MAIVVILDPGAAAVHKVLSHLQLTLVFAPTVAQFWSILEQLQPDVAICDISSGDVSGRAIAEKCRTVSPATSVLFTGPPICRLQTVRLIEQGLVVGFLSKPWQVGPVIDVMKGVLPNAALHEREAMGRALKKTERREVAVSAGGRRKEEAGGEAGRYRLDELIGEGGSGRVYRAHDLLLDMPVAVKLLHEFLYTDPQALAELLAEARVSMSLSHPHIVRLYNLEKRGGHYFLVIEYIDGPSLSKILQIKPKQDFSVISGILSAVAAALDHAHEAGVVHSDLTPANVIFTSDGIPKLIDFGIAALVNQHATPGEFIAGTPSYMSPEQLRGEAIGPASDIFSLGVLAYQILSGYLPQSSDATLEDLAFRGRPRLVGINEKQESVIGRALAFDPARRWPGATEFVEALLDCFN
jgi:CheY-like chemotaxis protein